MDFDEARKECICRHCPTYEACDEPWAFCMHDEHKSICISKERGCFCADCPVYSAQGFTFGYYCTRGNEGIQARGGEATEPRASA